MPAVPNPARQVLKLKKKEEEQNERTLGALEQLASLQGMYPSQPGWLGRPSHNKGGGDGR